MLLQTTTAYICQVTPRTISPRTQTFLSIDNFKTSGTSMSSSRISEGLKGNLMGYENLTSISNWKKNNYHHTVQMAIFKQNLPVRSSPLVRPTSHGLF